MKTNMKIFTLFLTCLAPAAAWWKDSPVCYSPTDESLFAKDKGDFLLKELARLKIPCNCPWNKICSNDHPSGATYNTQQVKDTFSMLKSTTYSCYGGEDCDAAKESRPENDPSWVKGQSEICTLKTAHDSGNSLFWSYLAYGVRCECKWSEVCSTDHPNGETYNQYKLKDSGDFGKSYCAGRTEPCQDKKAHEEEKKAKEEEEAAKLSTASVVVTSSLVAIVVAGVGAALV